VFTKHLSLTEVTSGTAGRGLDRPLYTAPHLQQHYELDTVHVLSPLTTMLTAAQTLPHPVPPAQARKQSRKCPTQFPYSISAFLESLLQMSKPHPAQFLPLKPGSSRASPSVRANSIYQAYTVQAITAAAGERLCQHPQLGKATPPKAAVPRSGALASAFILEPCAVFGL
jgi:hypothetical protein